MEAKDRCGRCGGDGLIPGLPEEIVLAHVLTRLPWYARPVCRTLSKSWREWIDTITKRRPEFQLKSRKVQLPLLNGCVLVCTFDSHIFTSEGFVPDEEMKSDRYYSLEWRDYSYQIHKQWRKLPPLQGLLPPPPTCATLLGSSGIVYVWSNVEAEDGFVLKIDLGCGEWTWNKIPVPHSFNENAVDFHGKIYVPRVLAEELENQEKEMVLVYDMMTDGCEIVKAWNRDNLRVLQKKSPNMWLQREEEMYTFVEHESLAEPKLEILVYDAYNDSWRTRDKIPIPECRWSELPQVKLVNGDCFEPVSDEGINTVWVDTEGEVLSWFNSSLHEDWIEFNYNVFVEGKDLEYIQFIHGSLFGMFIEDKDGQDDEGEEEKHVQEGGKGDQQDPELFKRTLMKGTMVVSSNTVNWEEVLDIGCFQEAYNLKPAVVSPIDHYTLMV